MCRRATFGSASPFLTGKQIQQYTKEIRIRHRYNAHANAVQQCAFAEVRPVAMYVGENKHVVAPCSPVRPGPARTMPPSALVRGTIFATAVAA
jgi:hypothetical protein